MEDLYDTHLYQVILPVCFEIQFAWHGAKFLCLFPMHYRYKQGLVEDDCCLWQTMLYWICLLQSILPRIVCGEVQGYVTIAFSTIEKGFMPFSIKYESIWCQIITAMIIYNYSFCISSFLFEWFQSAFYLIWIFKNYMIFIGTLFKLWKNISCE